MTPTDVVESYLSEHEIPFERTGDNAWAAALAGERKHSIPVAIVVRERTLALESFFMRAPMENAGETYRLLLARNLRPSPVRFAADADGDVYLVGELPLDGLDADAIDAILGALLSTADAMFDHAVALGFATYLARDRAWRERAETAAKEKSRKAHEPPSV